MRHQSHIYAGSTRHYSNKLPAMRSPTDHRHSGPINQKKHYDFMLYDNIKRRNRILHSHAPVYSMCRGNLLRPINSNYEAVGRCSNVWPFYFFFFFFFKSAASAESIVIARSADCVFVRHPYTHSARMPWLASIQFECSEFNLLDLKNSRHNIDLGEFITNAKDFQI